MKNEETAREQSEHVLYEIQMFYALLRYFETGEVDRAVARFAQQGLPVRNAVIEAFEIHARQLIEVSDGSAATQQSYRRRLHAREVETAARTLGAPATPGAILGAGCPSELAAREVDRGATTGSDA